jgi:hypothetical protein
MSRLWSFLPRGRALVWTVVALVLGPILLLVLASLVRVDLVVDVGAVLTAIGVVIVALALYHGVRHLVKPRETLSVGYNLHFEQPTLPIVGRYVFRLEVFYELEEKGERRRVDQGTIELRFKREDHPELLAWCRGRISDHLAEHARYASERYPGVRVLLPPEPSQDVLAEELGLPAPSPDAEQG